MLLIPAPQKYIDIIRDFDFYKYMAFPAISFSNDRLYQWI